jgi:pantoate--beta-alanine ligase
MNRPVPLVASTRVELAAALASRQKVGSPTVLVPTMGALHAGHAALFRRARKEAGDGAVMASIFVNPLQFAPDEDLDRYPRTLEDDLAMAGREGVDVVFTPAVDEMYPDGEPLVTVEPGPLGSLLEGESRPGHFRGVLTVVAKLFGLTRSDVAIFGQKDYQQLVLVTRMSRDLCLGVEVVGAETVREGDGLALSSRNRYLEPEDRQRATVLSRALRAAQDRAAYGVPAARWAAMRVLDEVPGLEVDYLTIRTPDLAEIEEPHPHEPLPARILVAARVGGTRLIDNMPLTIGGATVPATRPVPGGQ